MKPLVIDLCCGLGGWTRGFLAEGWDAIGFDIEKHEYGDKRYPAELLLKDIRQVCGYDLRAANPALVVASPPCQRYSYMAMPWSRAKEQAAQIWADETGAALKDLNELFDACFRIARECGVPLVVENVKGAQPWVGAARAHFGSYYLWGDIESVGGRIVGACPQFGQTLRAARRGGGTKCPGQDTFKATGAPCGKLTNPRYPSKNDGGSCFNVAHNTESGVGQNTVNGIKGPGGDWFANGRQGQDACAEGIKQRGSGPEWFDKALDERRREAAATKGGGGGWFEANADAPMRQGNSKSNSRKAASAMIAEIPFELARYVARVFKPV